MCELLPKITQAQLHSSVLILSEDSYQQLLDRNQN